MTILIYRNEDLSMFYFIKNMFQDLASFIEIVDSFPERVLTIPTISIDAGKIKEELFEMGDKDKVRIRTWYIDVFAKNKSQRDDFGYKILDKTKNGINIYDYNEGFPPDIIPTKIGHMDILSISYEPVPVMLDESEPLHFRGQVILVTQNDTV